MSAGAATRAGRLDGVAVATVLACAVLWGLNQVATKVALGQVPPLLQASLRSCAAALLVLAWSRARGIRVGWADGTLGAGLAAGTLFAAEFACIFVGLQYTSASRMVVFIYLSPFVVAAGMPFVHRGERIDARQLAGLLVAFGGVAWAFAEGFAHGGAAPPRQGWGDALGLAAALLWGATTLVIRATRLAVAPAEQTLLYQLAVSGALLGLAAWVAGEPWPQQVGPLVAASLGFQIVVVSFASYLAWFWLVRHYPATELASFTLLTPIAGLVAGVALLDEPLTARLVVALTAVVVGLALVSARRRA